MRQCTKRYLYVHQLWHCLYYTTACGWCCIIPVNIIVIWDMVKLIIVFIAYNYYLLHIILKWCNNNCYGIIHTQFSSGTTTCISRQFVMLPSPHIRILEQWSILLIGSIGLIQYDDRNILCIVHYCPNIQNQLLLQWNNFDVTVDEKFLCWVAIFLT